MTAEISSVDNEISTVRLLFCQIEKTFHSINRFHVILGKQNVSNTIISAFASSYAIQHVRHVLSYAKLCFVCYCYRHSGNSVIRLRTARSSFDDRVYSYASLRKWVVNDYRLPNFHFHRYTTKKFNEIESDILLFIYALFSNI